MVFPQDLEIDADTARFADRFGVTLRTSSCGRFAQLLWPLGQPIVDVSNVSNPGTNRSDVIPCERCGSPARAGRGYCLSCVFQQGLEYDGENAGHWDDVLEAVNVRGAEWRIGNYQILQEIGRGGMGVIYRARQRNSQRIVALKRIISVHAKSRETLARFQHEAVIVASLRHPNILPIYELGETEDGLPFFTMKHAPGGTLLEAAQTLRPDPRRSVRLIAKVSRAMQYAHGEGVLHRDLKPGNILLDEQVRPSQAARHGIAHARLPWAFADSHYTPHNVAVGNHANWFQVLLRVNYSNLAAIVPGHHLGYLLYIMLRRAVRKIGAHESLAWFMDLLLRELRRF